MSAGLRGGCKQAWYSTTSTFTASTQISNVHNGSDYSTEVVSEEDGAGQQVSAGHRLTGTIRSTRVTASYLSTLIAHEEDCTNVYIKMMDNSNAIHRIGPGRVSVTRALGTPGVLNTVTISLSGFAGLVSDLVSIS